jgi:hypothetical protein
LENECKYRSGEEAEEHLGLTSDEISSGVSILSELLSFSLLQAQSFESGFEAEYKGVPVNVSYERLGKADAMSTTRLELSASRRNQPITPGSPCRGSQLQKTTNDYLHIC